LYGKPVPVNAAYVPTINDKGLNLQKLHELLERNHTYPKTEEGKAALANQRRRAAELEQARRNILYVKVNIRRMEEDNKEQNLKEAILSNVRPLFVSNPDQFKAEQKFLVEQKEHLTNGIMDLSRESLKMINKSFNIRSEYFTPQSARYKYNDRVINLHNQGSIFEVVLNELNSNIDVYESVSPAPASTSSPNNRKRKSTRKGSRKGSRTQRRSSGTRRA